MDLLSAACKRLESHDETLTLLNLSCRGVGSEGVKKLSRSCSFSAAATEQKQHEEMRPLNCIPQVPLVALWLEGNDIYPSGAKAISSILNMSPRLKYLYMSSNFIGDAGASALVPKAFQQCEVCNLGDNRISAFGAISIAETLANKDGESVVKTLILDNNLLGDEGAVAIANGLRENKTLKCLDLRYNKIGTDGLCAFRDVLKNKENTTLECFAFEEDGDHDEMCSRQPLRRRNRKAARLMERRTCPCETCQIRYEIEFYLALNRAGVARLGDPTIAANLWPRIMSKVSSDEPSLLFAILETRPDVPLRR
jgi:hypothetical protein